MTTNTTSTTLGARGQVYVTLRAATAYQRGIRRADLRIEEARRELTEQLLDAHCTREAEGTRAASYRARSHTTQLDISATVVLEGHLYVVVAANVRETT